MSSRKNSSSKDSGGMSGGGWAALLAGAAGAAIIAGASAYAGYKLHQHEEEKMKQDACASKDKELLAEDEREYGAGHPQGPDVAVLRKSATADGMNDQITEEWAHVDHFGSEGGTLHSQLLAYYSQYVRLDQRDSEEAQEVLVEVMQSVDAQLRDYNPVFKWCYRTLMPVGSEQENTQIIRPENFDFNVMFDMDSKIWQLIDCGAEEVQKKYPGRWLINRSSLSSCRRTPFDDHTVDGSLSPCLFSGAIAKALDINRLSGPRHKVKLAHQNARIMLVVHYNQDKSFYVNLHPSTRLTTSDLENKAEVVPWEAPWWQQTQLQDNPLFWRKCHADEEVHLLSNPVYRQCLQILKAIRINDPQLSLLDTYIYKTVLFHCMDAEDEWGEAALAERFLDLFKMLETFVHKKYLPHYFEPELNLLHGIDDQSLGNISQYIGRLLGEQQLHTLLQDRM